MNVIFKNERVQPSEPIAIDTVTALELEDALLAAYRITEDAEVTYQITTTVNVLRNKLNALYATYLDQVLVRAGYMALCEPYDQGLGAAAYLVGRNEVISMDVNSTGEKLITVLNAGRTVMENDDIAEAIAYLSC